MRDGLIHLTLKTEYSFKKVFGKLDDLIIEGSGAIGVADINNTFAHIHLEQLCKKKKIKPIFGARLEVFKSTSEKIRNSGPEYIFIAKNYDGLKEIYNLIKISYDNFYYKPKIGLIDVWKLSEDVIVIATNFEIQERIDYLGICHATNKQLLNCNLPHIAIDDNYYPDIESKKMYEILSSPRTMLYTYPQHILSYDEFMFHFNNQDAVNNTFKVASKCNVELKKAEMVKYHGDLNLRELCIKGAKKRGIDLSNKIYSERFERELTLIEDRKYTDYFLITAEMIIDAKKTMLVGPSRGSSAGSLICYLIYITEIDPIKFNLLFERFIDINRLDLPDIDIDFPDNKREKVIKTLIEDNGKDKVKRVANISRLKPKSAIGEFAQAIDIPAYETEEVKDAIIERSGGDARAAMRIQDTFESTEVGKEFINKYPVMKHVEKLENHARHTSVHAAGIIVCNNALTDYGGVNTRDDTVMMDKKGAEYLKLLKIDCLGLRTLTVLEDCAKGVGFDYKDYYDLPLDDQKTFDIFNTGRLYGIFQFEGYSLQSITKSMGVHKFNDIVAITALARPGALHSGGTTRYVKHSNGEEIPIYYGDIHKSITEESFGIVIYQEQMMNIAKHIGNMSWKDVNNLRRAASKSLGDEFFSKFKNKFMEGAIDHNKISINDAEAMWNDICHCGCLSGDTLIKNPHPNQMSIDYISLKELYRNNGCGSHGEYKKQSIYMVDPDEMIRPHRLIDVYQSGIKETFELKSSNGNSIRATKDHRFMIENGTYKKLSELKIGDKIIEMGRPKKETKNKPFKGTGSGAHNEWTGVTIELNDNIELLKIKYNTCQKCFISPYQETHHIDCDRENSSIENLLPVCRKCHKKIHAEIDGFYPTPHRKGKMKKIVNVISISNPIMEMTYDIAMPNPNNFVADNFIVHNSWIFNKSHAVAYGLISYWTAYAKAHYPLEFTIANLNNSRNEQSAVKILRDAVKNEGIEYTAIDPDESDIDWTIRDGKLLGGLTSIKGIGISKARDIIKRRKNNIPQTASITRKLLNPETVFNILFPCEYYWGDLYENFSDYDMSSPPSLIENIQDIGNYIFIGLLSDKNLRDLNEYQSVVKRGGKIIEEDTLFLNLTFEDDTDSIMATIDRYAFERMGREVSEKGIVDKDWYLIKGSIKNNWRRVVISHILNLNNHIGLKVMENAIN